MSYAFVAAKYFSPGAIVEYRAIVIHMAQGGGTVSWLTHPSGNVSATFVIEYSGRIVQMVKDGDASHSLHRSIDDDTNDAPDFGIFSPEAAKAVLGDGWSNPNAYMFSVELEGFAADGPKPVQEAALKVLVADLRARFPSIRGLLGHRDFQDYKPCPGALIPWEDLGGHGLFVEEDVTIGVIKGEDWTPRGGVKRPYRDRPDRPGGTIVGYIGVGDIVRSIAEATTPDGNRWRLTELNGAPAWLLRIDFDPIVDPSVDQQLDAFIARQPPADPIANFNAGVDAASIAALTARQ